jgi:poly(A) polymerase
MLERGILRPVLPEVEATALPRLQALVAAEEAGGFAADPLRRFAALLAPDPLLAERVAARVKLSNKARKRLASAADGTMEGTPEALAYRIGLEEAQDRLLLAGQAEAAAGLRNWNVPRLPIGGGALIARGLKPGPEVARTLKAIEQRWVDEGFPPAQRLEELVEHALRTARS